MVNSTLDLKGIKEVLDEVIQDEKRCHDVLRSLVLKENERFKSVHLDKVALILSKLSTVPPSDLLKELGQDG